MGETGNAMIAAMQTSLAEFSVSTLVPIIQAALTFAVPLVIGWFTFRWIYRKAKGALKRGV